MHAHPFSLLIPSPVKLQCTLQLSGYTDPVSSLPIYVLCGPDPRFALANAMVTEATVHSHPPLPPEAVKEREISNAGR